MDEYSYKCNCLSDYKNKNKKIQEEVEMLR